MSQCRGRNSEPVFYVDTLAGGSFWDLMAGAASPGVDSMSVDPSTGRLSHRRCLFDIAVDRDVEMGMTLPDGMTMDAEGRLWVAIVGAGQVRRYSVSGEVEAVVDLPVPCPTGVAFGGDDLGDLYVTTMTPHGAPGPDPRKPALMWDPKPL
jgi:sugar lactone lactonase YvrE